MKAPICRASEQPDDFRDVKFARVACRLYATLLAETGEERWKLELERHVAVLGGALVAAHVA